MICPQLFTGVNCLSPTELCILERASCVQKNSFCEKTTAALRTQDKGSELHKQHWFLPCQNANAPNRLRLSLQNLSPVSAMFIVKLTFPGRSLSTSSVQFYAYLSHISTASCLPFKLSLLPLHPTFCSLLGWGGPRWWCESCTAA